jgi:hypothetical protein
MISLLRAIDVPYNVLATFPQPIRILIGLLLFYIALHSDEQDAVVFNGSISKRSTASC